MFELLSRLRRSRHTTDVEPPFAQMNATAMEALATAHSHVEPARLAMLDRIATVHREVLEDDYGLDLTDPATLNTIAAVIVCIDDNTRACAEGVVTANPELVNRNAGDVTDITYGTWRVREAEGLGANAMRQLVLDHVRQAAEAV